jgi:CheY-like chemotaxis protein
MTPELRQPHPISQHARRRGAELDLLDPPCLRKENMRALQIIHIDDNDDDALLLSRALRQAPQATSFKWFPSAREAVGYLDHAANDEMPDLIFCDLRMPGMDGHDFVRWLRASKHHTVPVVVLSSSERHEDIRLAYELGANSFLTKPLSVPEIWEMIHNAIEFWNQCSFSTRAPES